ncbi:UDP-N-acetylmuramoyl-tripeptide--D-alanyl-D-alanine ligase [Bengtsoniella intestinalis]|uniref:UDP-N-acetylmuramoyl-tripeptide--D-alanyl-D- alanine ligase n=1 Tax=Bengtsoniella intestinalis TaxID=3073143 RepID=UPI00391FBACC
MMTLAQITTAVGGTLHTDLAVTTVVTAVCTDSRAITAGCLFVAWVGERFDGHDFIDQSLEAGAVATICRRLPETLQSEKAYIVVPDTRLALRDMAKAYRDGFEIPFLQITGSVGKTTTKELISAVLSVKKSVHKTPANYNNDIGTPLTLFGLRPEHEVAVIETGMNHFGEIRYLAQFVQPDIGIITNVGDAHVEFLGSRDGILQAKSELFEGLKPEGVAILNGDDTLLNTVQLPQKILRCGTSDHCDIQVTAMTDLGLDGIACTVQTAQNTYELHIHALGKHMIYPVSMAVAVGELLGLSKAEIEAGVAGYRGVDNRMNVVRLGQNRIVLDDCYNASPQSMEAGLAVLKSTPAKRKIAIIGDMGELGDYTQEAHYTIGKLAGSLGLDLVITIGAKAADMEKGARDAGGNVVHFATKEDAYDAIGKAFLPDTLVFVKASHFSMHFEDVVNYLKELDIHD